MKKKFVFFLALTLAAISAKAVSFTWTSDDYTVTASDLSVQGAGGDVIQVLQVNGPGALAAFVQATKDNANSPLNGIGSEGGRVNLRITGELNDDDLSALNSTTASGWSTFTSVDLSGATISSFDDLSGMSMSSLQYLRLPANLDDNTEMATLNTNNQALALVLSTDDQGDAARSVSMHSFVANSLAGAVAPFCVYYGGGNDGFKELKTVKTVAMSGIYGDTDLSGRFGSPAYWDFTGANFALCTVALNITTPYHEYDDPFELGSVTSPNTDSYATNAFFYFQEYADKVVDIKLPDQLEELPPLCLSQLGASNAANYKWLKNMSDADFEAQFGNQTTVPLETLVIPSSVVKIDFECAKWAHIKSVVIGSGVKILQGGAFCYSDDLEDIDFAPGISDCYIGSSAFFRSNNVKHVALVEGIVSIGAYSFAHCYHMESIRLPETLINIGSHAFDNNLALSSITIPSNVEKIGMLAFNLCPFTDIYLTSTDPNKIPIVYSCGTDFNNFDGNCTFYHGHLDGWEGIMGLNQNTPDLVAELATMTFEEAAAWYFSRFNGIPVLHYPKELADKVRADIAARYEAHSSDGYGLPMAEDMAERANPSGSDMGSAGQGKYTQDGWAQFMLMKEYVANSEGGDVYSKEWDDVWYTMCFPFDMSDEVLAAAFNENFNIVDFSGVEIIEADDNEEGKKTLVLHFNTIGETIYKDTEGNVYERMRDNDGNVIREEHGRYKYNVYQDAQGNIYHHVHASAKLDNNKTKTFAIVSEPTTVDPKQVDVKIIDGILASAGHPYMIHPNIGIAHGDPKKVCHFAGITWIPEDQRAALYEAQARTVDLGVEKKTNNFQQEEYTEYAGQTYTFKGNWKAYKDDAPAEPTVENGGLQALPPVTNYTDLYPDGPAVPVAPVAVEPSTPEITTPPTPVQDPDENSKYADVKNLFNTVRCANVYLGYIDGENRYQDFTYGEDLANYSWSDFFVMQEWYNGIQGTWYLYSNRSNAHNENVSNLSSLESYLGAGPLTSLDGFNALKSLAVDYAADKAALANYDVEYAAYEASKKEWDDYRAALNYDPVAAQQQYEADTLAYNNAVRSWQAACNAINESNASVLEAWEASLAGYGILIPTNAYFLGRVGTGYPKFYREVSTDEDRTTGLWTQYTAIVMPNDAAIAGIEAELGAGNTQSGGTGNARNYRFVIDEDFSDYQGVTEIEQIVAEAQEKGQSVEYMDVVVSINGQVVRRGDNSLEGLPKGLYIVNGKKYFVK